MENMKNDRQNKNTPDDGILEAKLDPKNEIASASSEEKLISSPRRNGLGTDMVGSANKAVLEAKTMGQDKNFSKADKVVESGAAESEKSYGKCDASLYATGGSNRKKMLPIIAIVGVLFLAVTVVAAMYVFDIGGFGKKKETPQDIIKSSMAAMRDVKTYNMTGNIKVGIGVNGTAGAAVSGDETGNMKYDINIDMSGKTDMSDINNVKSDANMNVQLKMSSDVGNEDYSVELEGRSFGTKEFYYKLNNMDLGMLGMIIGTQVSQYKGKWYVLDFEELKKLPGYSDEEAAVFGNYNMNRIMEIMSKYKLLQFKEDIGDEVFGDVKVYHYKIGLDGVSMIYMYLDILKEVASGSKNMNAKEFESDVEKMKKDIEENYMSLINEGFQNIEADVWIGKSDRLVYRIAIGGMFDEKYINKIMNATLGSAKAKAQDAAVKSSVFSERTDLELYYDRNKNSYENYKLSKYSRLKQENIRLDKDSYVIWSDLASVEDKWCADSSGKSGYVLGDITGYSCPELSENPKGNKEQYSEIEKEEDNVKASVSFNVDISYNDFNKTVMIEKPEGAINFFDEAKKSMFGKDPLVKQQNPDTDNDGLEDYMESYYNTDPNNPDTDGDGYKDGDEVKNGYDPTKSGNTKLEYGNFAK